MIGMCDTVDRYKCPECGWEWGGHGRSPPYAHCPKCGEAMMRQVTVAESDLLDTGFVPRRFA